MQQDWEALCDGDLDIEEKDSGSESSTDSNWLLRLTEHTAHTGRKQLSLNTAERSQSKHIQQTSPVKTVTAKQTSVLIVNNKSQKFCLLDLDDVHAGDSQADMVSGCSPVQSLVM